MRASGGTGKKGKSFRWKWCSGSRLTRALTVSVQKNGGFIHSGHVGTIIIANQVFCISDDSTFNVA
jgi:hypothetical protein